MPQVHAAVAAGNQGACHCVYEGLSACCHPCCRGDLVQIETYFTAEGRVGARRDWVIRSAASGEILGRATRSAPVVTVLC